jgi:hypothetical protein
MPALTKERVEEFIDGAKDVAKKIDAVRGLLAQIRQANDALGQNWLALHTDFPALFDTQSPTVDSRIAGQTFTPKQVNQFTNIACVQLENFLNNAAVTQGNHGDTVKRLSKVIV